MKISARPTVWLALLAVIMLGVTACGSGTSQQAEANGPSSAVVSVSLSPKPVYANNTLAAVVAVKNPQDTRQQYAYQWRKNDVVVEEAKGRSLPNTFFKKGDVITVTVTVNDGPAQGTSVTSEPITIQNSAPVATVVTVAPNPLQKQGTLQASVKGYDVDGDAIAYAYQWFKNGAEIQGQTAATMDSALIAKGDLVEVQVTPSDVGRLGEPRLSVPMAVQNTSPRVMSQPTASLAEEEDSYLYQVKAEDPDGDAITYSLTSAPPRMSIDPSTGLIRWSVTINDVGIHPIEVTVTDTDGSKSMQRYDLQISDLKKSSAARQP